MQSPNKPFENQWYVIALSEEVRPGKKIPVRLFSHEIIVWRDQNRQLSAIDARCPHMGASLALGRVVDGAVDYRKMRLRKLAELKENTPAAHKS